MTPIKRSCFLNMFFAVDDCISKDLSYNLYRSPNFFHPLNRFVVWGVEVNDSDPKLNTLVRQDYDGFREITEHRILLQGAVKDCLIKAYLRGRLAKRRQNEKNRLS